MSVEVVTREDLQAFRLELINDIKELLLPQPDTSKKWLRSTEVRKQLSISAGTLQKLPGNWQAKILQDWRHSFL